jgi:hypothetical protein
MLNVIYCVTCKPVMMSVIMLSVIMLSVIMLSVIMLSVVMLCVIMLSVIMLSVVMLNVVTLSVDMLNVVAPFGTLSLLHSCARLEILDLNKKTFISLEHTSLLQPSIN